MKQSYNVKAVTKVNLPRGMLISPTRPPLTRQLAYLIEKFGFVLLPSAVFCLDPDNRG